MCSHFSTRENAAWIFISILVSITFSTPPLIAQESLPPCSGDDVAAWHECQSTSNYIEGRYSGEFRYGKPDGHGTFFWPDGRKFVGEFRDSKRVNGTETLPDGKTYTGDLKDGKFHGKGRIISSDGTSSYQGEFKNNLPNGQGTLRNSDGSKFVGGFNNGLPTYGTEIEPNGQKYIGNFKNGRHEGQGTLIIPGGEKYVGEFSNGKKSGQGTTTFPSGEKFVGAYKDDQPNGEGTLYAADGAITSSGAWVNGKFIGAIGSEEMIPMQNESGVFVVPVRLNDAILLKAIVDSGAADVAVPSDIVSTLIRTGTISNDDFLGVKTYILADGTKVPSQVFRMRRLKVGSRVLENVIASVSAPKAPILLGQSFLNRFSSWSIDNERHVLLLR